MSNTNAIKSADFEITEASNHLHNRELKASKNPEFEFSLDIAAANGEETVDTSSTELRTTFAQNLRYWNDQTMFLSTNNLDNAYYRNIVAMGLDAVPLILEEIKKRPSNLVHALDEIMPGVIEYTDGYISIEDVCNAWISILKPIETA